MSPARRIDRCCCCRTVKVDRKGTMCEGCARAERIMGKYGWLVDEMEEKAKRTADIFGFTVEDAYDFLDATLVPNIDPERPVGGNIPGVGTGQG